MNFVEQCVSCQAIHKMLHVHNQLSRHDRRWTAGACVVNVYINYEKKFAFVELRTGKRYVESQQTASRLISLPDVTATPKSALLCIISNGCS